GTAPRRPRASRQASTSSEATLPDPAAGITLRDVRTQARAVGALVEHVAAEDAPEAHARRHGRASPEEIAGGGQRVFALGGRGAVRAVGAAPAARARGSGRGRRGGRRGRARWSRRRGVHRVLRWPWRASRPSQRECQPRGHAFLRPRRARPPSLAAAGRGATTGRGVVKTGCPGALACRTFLRPSPTIPARRRARSIASPSG